MKRLKKGFTLIELLVVIAIIGILATTLAPKLREQLAKAKDSKAIAFLGAARTAVEVTLIDKLVQDATSAGAITITLKNITDKLDTKSNDLIKDADGTIPVGASRTDADGNIDYVNNTVGLTGTTSGGAIITSSVNMSVTNDDVDLFLMGAGSTKTHSTEGKAWLSY